MDLTWSIEDVARTSDDAAVHRRFAQRNRVWLTFLMVFAAFATFGQLMSTSNRGTVPSEVAVAFANGVWMVLCLFLLRYAWRAERTSRASGALWRAGAWLRTHINAAALIFVTVQYTFNLAFTRRGEDWIAWVFLYPMFTL